MAKMNSKQKGMGFISLMICLSIFGFLVYLVLAIYPLYYQKMVVMASMKYVVSQPNSPTASVTEIRKMFLRNMNATSNVKGFDERTVKEYVNVQKASKKNGTPKMLHVKYEYSNKFIKDLFITLKFEEAMAFGKQKTGG